MSITSFLALQVKPESVSDAGEIIHRILNDTRAFAGCLSVEVLIDRQDPAHIVLVEKWESFEHDAAYRAWRATPEGAAGLREILVAPPELTLFTEATDV